jgi:hypothetical protein
VSRRILVLAFAALLLGALSSRARADIEITATNVTISGGGIGYMDFTVSSTDGDTLSAFGLTLQITPVNPANAGDDLQFTTSQPNAWDPTPYPNSSFTGSDYVFAGVSGVQSLGQTYWALPSQTGASPPYLSITSNADYDSSGSVQLTSTSYLGSVEFQAAAVSSQEQFQVSLAGGTYFADSQGNNLNFSLLSGGSVTVNPYMVESMSVPEPTAALTSLTGALCFAAYGWLRLRRASATGVPERERS